MKRKIICALDEYEDIPNRLTTLTNLETGITQGAFIEWFRKQCKNDKHLYEKVRKCIDDCKEDGYIKEVFVNGQRHAVIPDDVMKPIEY